jgi:hypothetical protein
MSNKQKHYTLSDGSVTTADAVCKTVKGLSITSARVRLTNSTDPLKIFMPKGLSQAASNDNYKLRSIKSREASIYNEMFVLAFKTI